MHSRAPDLDMVRRILQKAEEDRDLAKEAALIDKFTEAVEGQPNGAVFVALAAFVGGHLATVGDDLLPDMAAAFNFIFLKARSLVREMEAREQSNERH